VLEVDLTANGRELELAQRCPVDDEAGLLARYVLGTTSMVSPTGRSGLLEGSSSTCP
jgi:hypothetical protein